MLFLSSQGVDSADDLGVEGKRIDSSDSSLIFGAFRISSRKGCCSLFVSSVLGGVSGCVAEVIPFPFDDNLYLPVVSGVLFLTLHQWHSGRCE